MEFQLPNEDVKAYLEFFDDEENSIAKVEKSPETNHKGKPVVSLRHKDIPSDAKYVQCVVELDGQEARSGLFYVNVIESPPTSKRDQGLTLVGTFPAPPYDEEVRHRLGKVYKLLLDLADEEDQEEGVQEIAQKDAIYEGLSYDERIELVFTKWKNDELDISEMTEVERIYWKVAMDRDSQRSDNLRWNIKHHHFFLERIDQFTDYLTKEENEFIDDLMRAKKWGNKEIEQVKEIAETAQWAKQVQSKIQNDGSHQ